MKGKKAFVTMKLFFLSCFGFVFPNWLNIIFQLFFIIFCSKFHLEPFVLQMKNPMSRKHMTPVDFVQLF